MGSDKAKLTFDGRPLAERSARGLADAGYPVTVLGREAIPSFAFQRDDREFEGPLAALAGHEPNAELVFVLACDLPRFDPRAVAVLAQILEDLPDTHVALPFLDGRRQPLCALYRWRAWRFLPDLIAQGKRSMMAWLDGLTVRDVSEPEWQVAGIDPGSFKGVNSPEDLRRMSHEH